MTRCNNNNNNNDTKNNEKVNLQVTWPSITTVTFIAAYCTGKYLENC